MVPVMRHRPWRAPVRRRVVFALDGCSQKVVIRARIVNKNDGVIVRLGSRNRGFEPSAVMRNAAD